MAVGTFSSRILGFLRDAIMFHIFPKTVTDCYVVAFRLPNMFRRLLGEGSMSASFIPIYAHERQKSPERAKQLSDAIFTIVLTVAVVISLTCFVFMEQIIRYLVDDPRGYAAVPGKVEQTIFLARIMIFYLVLVTTYAQHMSIANTLGHFFIPSLGPTLFNAGLICFTILPFEIGSVPGSAQAWGVIFGGVLQAGVVLWLLVRIKALPHFTFRLRAPNVGSVFLNMVPGLFGLGVYQIMLIVNTKFAARLSEGAQSYIYAADRILELPQSLIAVSLGAALLPRFSALHAAGEKDKFLGEANQAVKMLLFLSLPSAVGMWVLSDAIVEVLFMRGQFNAESARQTAEIVEIYAVLMLFSSLARVTTPAFYALKNTWLPAAVAACVLGLHIFVGSYMVNHFGLRGLAFATSTASILNIIILQIFFYFIIGPLGYGSIVVSILKMLPALAALAAFAHFGYPFLHLYVGRTIALGVVIGVGMFIYFGVGILSGCEVAVKVTGVLTRRFTRKAKA
jgi:putative peptidoglycan lipid II flippase